MINDKINPRHYKNHPSGIECHDITQHMNFNLGNCVKYIWRADFKGDTMDDLKKARWYLDSEINRLSEKQRLEDENRFLPGSMLLSGL